MIIAGPERGISRAMMEYSIPLILDNSYFIIVQRTLRVLLEDVGLEKLEAAHKKP